jgi:carboxyl-terminal processing protease
MLSAALKEEYGAIVVGENSYGKGTVQELLELNNNVEYKITTKKWLTPKGNWIHGKGVEPNVKIMMNQEYYDNPNEDTDNQLKAAVEEAVK